MRLRALHLDRFGHFTDRRYEFGAAGDGPDFHIIHGSNEAGKTTTMEAVLRLFYGFPLREPYAFKHQRPNLRVSAVLDIDGEPRRFTRLPKRAGALLDAAGTALPETALAAHLGGLGETDYRNLLCLDDDTIERGGEDIAQARGDIGKLLFSAAAGVADLSTVLDGVREEADALWRKRASKTRIADLKRELAQVDKDMRRLDVTASAWRALKRALDDARAQETEARKRRDEVQDRTARIAARRRALPLLTRIDAVTPRIAPFAAFPERLDFDPETLVALLTDEAEARADLDRLAARIADLGAERDALERAPGLVALSEELDPLTELAARDLTASMDLDRRRALVREAEAAMARAAQDLGAAPQVDPTALVLSPAQLARLEETRDTLRAARRALASEAQEVADLTERRDTARTQRDAVAAKAPRDRGLAEVLERFDADVLLPRYATARQAIDTARSSERGALAALALGAARFDALPECPTTPAAARDWLDEDNALAARIATCEDARARHRADLAAHRAQERQLAETGQFVTDSAAADLHAHRDRLWQAHLATLDPGTAQDFEAAMRDLDTAQAARLSHARDLGQVRQIAQAAAEAQARADMAEKELAEARAARAALEDKVTAAAAATLELADGKTVTVAEWHEWVTRHAAASEAVRDRQDTEAQHHATLDRVRRLRDALAPHLALDELDLEAAISAARRRAETDRAALAALDQAESALDTLDADLTRRIARRDSAHHHAKAAQADWQALIESCLQGRVAADTAEASLEPLRSLRALADKRTDAAQRVARMENDQHAFATAVADLAAAHDLPLSGAPAEDFTMLRRRAETARATEDRAAALTAEIATTQEDMARARARLDDIARQVGIMGRIFPDTVEVGTLEQLRRAVTQAQAVIADRQQLAELEHQVLTELGARDLAGARAALADVSAVTLEAEAESCKADLAAAEKDLTVATETRVTAAQDLARVTGDADIAALAERRATLELELEEAARAHLELALGARLADMAIRRYRDSHRSGMMTATERCFAALTTGAYSRLTTQSDGADETLLALDGDGVAKRVEDMSKGTRFQLYLALRAAAHEQLVAQGTRLPFFCDDIFETFDEDRTRAACRVMERIGHSGQAIYLTHHRHVVEIAREVCDVPPKVHEV